MFSKLPPINRTVYFSEKSVNPENDEYQNKQIQRSENHWFVETGPGRHADQGHECVDITADSGSGEHDATRLLDRVAIFRRYRTFRDKYLDENGFESLEPARPAIATRRVDYHEIRPHGNCGRMPPSTFAAWHRQISGDAKQRFNPDAGIS